MNGKVTNKYKQFSSRNNISTSSRRIVVSTSLSHEFILYKNDTFFHHTTTKLLFQTNYLFSEGAVIRIDFDVDISASYNFANSNHIVI